MEKQRVVRLAKLYLLKAMIELLRMIRDNAGRKKRRFGVRPILRRRGSKGYFHNLVAEMRLKDTDSFINFHRMDEELFADLLSILGPSINNIPFRKSEEITAQERLSVTLRYIEYCLL